MICPYCQHDISSESEYCPSCGTKLSSESIDAKELWKREQDANKTLYFLEEANQKRARKPSKNHSKLSTAAMVLIAALALGSILILPAPLYNKANELMEDGNYKTAKTIFTIIKDHKNAQELADICTDKINEQTYIVSADAFNSGDINTAIEGFESISGYKDADTYLYRSQKNILDSLSKRIDFDFTDSITETAQQLAVTNSNVYTKPVLNGSINAASFDGNASYLEVAGDTDFGIGRNTTILLTFSCWDTFAKDADGHSKHLYLYSDDADTQIYIYDGKINVFISRIPERGVYSYQSNLSSKTTIENGKWYSIAVVCEDHKAKLYINGVEEDSSKTDKTHVDGCTTMCIGQRYSPEHSGTDSYSGYIADYTLYNSILDDSTIQRYSNSFNGISVTNYGSIEIPRNSVEWNGNRYALFNNCSTWSDANAFAEQIGGHLATFSSSDENYAIFNWLYSIGQPDVFFGLSNDNDEKVYKWVTNEPMDFTNWREGMPDGNGYVYFDPDLLDGTWSNSIFTANSPYLIEWENVSADYPT